MTKRTAPAVLFILLIGQTLAAGERTDSGVNWRIRQEAADNSQIMGVIHHITDIVGPRLTGSPSFTAACRWALEQLKLWGLQNENLEPWDFKHPGWANERYSVRVLSPFAATLTSRVIAWTPGTKGIVRAPVVQIDPPDKPSQEILADYLNGIREKVRGKIVLAGKHTQIPITFNPPFKRREDSDLIAQFDPNRPAPARVREQPADQPKFLDPREVEKSIDAFLLEAGAQVKVIDAARLIFQITGWSPSEIFFDTSKPVGVFSRAADLTRARASLGWEPGTSFEDGLRRTIDWYYATRDRAEVARKLNVLLTER